MDSQLVVELNLQRDYKNFRYFIDGTGNVISQAKTEGKERTVVVPNAFVPEAGYFYFLTKEGNIARTVRVHRKKKEQVTEQTTEVAQ